MEDNVVHLACKVFNNDDFSSISEAKKSLLSRNQNENYQYLTNKKHGYLIHTWSDIGFKSTTLNQISHSINEGSIGIMFTVPLRSALLLQSSGWDPLIGMPVAHNEPKYSWQFQYSQNTKFKCVG